MIRRNTLFVVAIGAVFLAGCTLKGPDDKPAEQTKTAQQTQTVEQAPLVQTVATQTTANQAPGVETARGIVVRRAETLNGGYKSGSTTHIHLMIQMTGPNDEKVYLSFAAFQGFQQLPLARVGDRVELTYINKGFIDVQTFGITEPAMPSEGK
jgi:hypothetical protein